MSNFITNEDDRIFRIWGHNIDAPCYTAYSNGESNSIELTYILNSREIVYMACFALDQIYELPFSPPNSEKCLEIDAEPVEKALWYKNEDEFPCVCTLSKDEFTIIVDPDSEDLMDPFFFYKDGRVEYMYDDCMCLLYIKVVELTKREYEFLKGFC